MEKVKTRGKMLTSTGSWACFYETKLFQAVLALQFKKASIDKLRKREITSPMYL